MAMGNNPSQGTHTFEGSNAGRTGTDAKDKLQNVADKARETASHLGDKAREAASNLGDKARETASHLGQQAHDAGTSLKGRTDDTLSTVGQKMSSLADNLRERAPHEGMMGSAASSVADTMRSGGQYLQQHNLDDMGRDITNVVRQYPLQSLLVGFGVGCLMGMAFRR